MNIAHGSGAGVESHDSDSDWEYEYSNTETEVSIYLSSLYSRLMRLKDFYVLVEFPQPKLAVSRVGEEIVPSMFNAADISKGVKRRNVPPIKSTNRRKRRRRRDPETGELKALTDSENEEENEARGQDEDQEDENNEDDGDEEDRGSTPKQQQKPDGGPLEQILTDASGLRLIGLNSKEPLMMLNNGKVYQLEWATGLGTDMYFGQRDETSDAPGNVLKSFGNWDLISCSAARLVASEAKLRYKQDPVINFQADETDGAEGAVSVSTNAKKPGFMRRFVETQIKKGELGRDEVIFPPEAEAAATTTNDHVPLSKRLAYNMLMGEVIERADGTPMVVSTRRPPEARKGTLPREIAEKLAPPDDDIVIVRHTSGEKAARSQTEG